jgi:hypothetical protein
MEALPPDSLEPSPLKVRLSVDATLGTPTVAAFIAHALQDAGAIVTFSDPRAAKDFAADIKPSLEGLNIHIGQLTWVRDEEAQRWGNQP